MVRSNEVARGMCGASHVQSDIELVFRRPAAIAALLRKQRRKVFESEEICATRDGRHFIRAVLPLPVAGRLRPYQIGLWVQVGKLEFEAILAQWESPDQARQPPFAVQLANAVPLHSVSTMGLKAELQLVSPMQRPKVRIVETDHPLFAEQQNGITQHRVAEYNACIFGWRRASLPAGQGRTGDH